MARVISLANQKGGVGKTTTTISLGAAIAERGFRVLLVDFDPQGALTVGIGQNPNALESTVYNLILDRSCKAESVVISTQTPQVDLLPANIDLSAAEVVLVSEVAREQALKRSLHSLRDHYDYILIDCQPSLGLLTINALTASDSVIIPLECEFFALRGMALLVDTIEKVKDRLNPDLVLQGIVATMYDSRTIHSREVLQRVREAFGDKLFNTVISRTIRFAEAPVVGEPILTYAPDSSGAHAYRNLAKEVLGVVNDQTSESAGSGRAIQEHNGNTTRSGAGLEPAPTLFSDSNPDAAAPTPSDVGSDVAVLLAAADATSATTDSPITFTQDGEGAKERERTDPARGQDHLLLRP